MSKKSNRGKGYFYAKGQRDLLNEVALTGDLLRHNRKILQPFAYLAWINGYHGF